jgi:DNA-binding response OmpR family regulator
MRHVAHERVHRWTPGAGSAQVHAVDGPQSLPSAAIASPVRILIVEDNAHFASTLRNNLEVEGFIVDVAPTVSQGLRQVADAPPGLVILNSMLPGAGGFELLRTIRRNGNDVPVIILTARQNEREKLHGFGLGADDFMTQPVHLPELLARIRVLVRRAHPAFASPAPRWIHFGDIELCAPARTVKRNGHAIELRPKEFDLLLALFRQHDRVVSRAELLRDVWGYDAATVSRTVDTHMAGLRVKLEADPLHPRHLLSVRTAGYLLRLEPEP